MTYALRYFWPLPWTVAGLLAATLAGLLGARWQTRHGVLEVHGGALAHAYRRLPERLQFEAITLGHVILGLGAHSLEAVRAHELMHVRQYERWGALFVPAYLASSLWHCLRGGCAYRDNRFEREAYAAAPACLLPAPGNDRAKVE